MKLPISIFQNECKEFGQHNLDTFYKSSSFTKEYKLEGNNIVPLQKV